jgi:hypothetical protein
MDEPYIHVTQDVFLRLRHDDFDSLIKARLTACLRVEPPRHPIQKRQGRSSWKAEPRPGKRPLNPAAASCPRLSAQALCNKISPLNQAQVQQKLLKLAETEAEVVVEVVLSNATSTLYYLELLLTVLGAMPHAIVGPHIERLTSAFVETDSYKLVDDLGVDDYDKFCAFLANKRKVRAEFLCIMTLGDKRRMDHLVEGSLVALGEASGQYCKDLLIDILHDHCKSCPSITQGVRAQCRGYLGNPQASGLDNKTRFKLMDLVSSLS